MHTVLSVGLGESQDTIFGLLPTDYAVFNSILTICIALSVGLGESQDTIFGLLPTDCAVGWMCLYLIPD